MLDKNRTFDDIEKNQMDQENQCSPLITSRDRRREYYNMKEAGRKVWQSQKLFDFPYWNPQSPLFLAGNVYIRKSLGPIGFSK
jgi:hypothetical protein